MNQPRLSWLHQIHPTEIRDGAEKPGDMPAEASEAWDLSAAGLTCRLGRIVIRWPDSEDDLEIAPEIGDFLADIAKRKTIRNWTSPVYLGPHALPCHDGSLTVTTEHCGNDRIFRGVGLWVPEGKYSIEGIWMPDNSIQIDHTQLNFDKIK